MKERPVWSCDATTNPWRRDKPSTAQAGARARKRKEKKKEKEKSDFSFPSFDAATIAFGLEAKPVGTQ